MIPSNLGVTFNDGKNGKVTKEAALNVEPLGTFETADENFNFRQ